MPLLAEPETSDIDCNFDSFTYLEISSCTVPDVDAGEVHPALSKGTSNEAQMDGSVVGFCGGMTGDRGGVVKRGGNTAARWGKGADDMQFPLQLHSKELNRRLAEISTATVSDGPSN
eukprot:1056786-Rhodomonas_salina.1